MTTRTQQILFGQEPLDLFVIVKHRIESTIVTFIFENEEEPKHEFNLRIEILKNEPVFFIERAITVIEPEPNRNLLYDQVKMYEKIGGQFRVEWLNGTRNMTSDQRQDFRIKWQEALDKLIHEDTFTFEIPTYLCEVLALENELFQIDLEYE